MVSDSRQEEKRISTKDQQVFMRTLEGHNGE